jgi:hypothetical protein
LACIHEIIEVVNVVFEFDVVVFEEPVAKTETKPGFLDVQVAFTSIVCPAEPGSEVMTLSRDYVGVDRVIPEFEATVYIGIDTPCI